MFRSLVLGSLLALLAAPAAARAADKADGPAVMLRIQSVDQILDNAEYLAALAGQEEAAKQFLGFVKALSGEKGIEGVDTKRPFVLYANVAQEVEKSQVVLMVPIADQESFVGLLKQRLSLEITDEKNGLFSTNVPNAPGAVYFRFENKYLYGTFQNKDNIDPKKLAKPEDVAGKGTSVLELSVRVDRIPEPMKQFALATVETALAQAKQAPIPNETDKIKQVKEKAVDSLTGGIKSVLFDGKEINLKIGIDRKKDELALEFELTAKEGSDLAKDFADLKSKKSVALGSLASGKAAMQFAMNLSLPASVKKVLGPAVDEAVKTGLGMAPGEIQEAVEPLVKAVAPTLKAGDFDGGLVFLGPDAKNHYTAVVAGKVADGKKIEAEIKELVKKIPEPVKSAFEVDADSAGDYKLHRIKVGAQLDDNAKKIFGETDMWFAFRDDAALVAFGPDAKSALKDALGKAPAAGSIAKVEMSVSRLIALAESQDPKAAQKAAKEAFGKDPTGDTLSITVEGGESVRLRGVVKGKVIKFFVLLDKAKRGE